jgi:hypothetical protein
MPVQRPRAVPPGEAEQAGGVEEQHRPAQQAGGVQRLPAQQALHQLGQLVDLVEEKLEPSVFGQPGADLGE